mgnify:CR=1 FL=1
MKPSRLCGSDRSESRILKQRARKRESAWVERVRRREESEKEVSRSLVTAATAIVGAVVGVDSPGTSKVGESSAETNEPVRFCIVGSTGSRRRYRICRVRIGHGSIDVILYELPKRDI